MERALDEAETPVAADAAPRAAPSAAAGALWLQRHAGNRATARLVARERSKSVRKGPVCEPARTIQGTVFVPARDDEIAIAKKVVDGSTAALAKQQIVLDLDVKPFLELGDLAFSDKAGDRSIDSYATLCTMLRQLNVMRSKPGVVVIVVPISGEICSAHGSSCYVPDFGKRCPPGLLSFLERPPDKLIVVGKFPPPSPTVLAHELGHHAGQPRRGDPSEWGHEEHDPHNYMGYDPERDHYRSELLDRMCGVSFQF